MRRIITTIALAAAVPVAAQQAPRTMPMPAPARGHMAIATTRPAPAAAPGQIADAFTQPAPTARPLPPLPPMPWVQQDPADSLWRAARQSLDRGDNAAAAAAYRRIRTEARFAQSAYRSHSFYWEAFARQRIGSTAELRNAQSLLTELRRRHPNFESMAEAERLSARITADLAARGDAQSASRATATAVQAAACPDQDLRAAAVESLITMPAQHALPVLEQVMARKDECNAKLRESAIFMIAQKGGARAEDILLEAARTDPHPKVREQAVFWLSQVNTERAVDAIEQILRTSSDPKLVEMSVFALSQHRSPRAAQMLRDIATRPGLSTEARKNAIFHLGHSRGADVSATLRNIYSSTNEPSVKEAVLFALSQRRDEGIADWMLDVAMNTREPIDIRKHALFWASQQRTLSLSKLTELYGTMPDRAMKEQIIFSISQRREPEAVEHLIEIARRETDSGLRRTLLFWLGQSNDPRAARFIAEIIGG
jgi:HEAT repeat protein